jgi:hypothetical protein
VLPIRTGRATGAEDCVLVSSGILWLYTGPPRSNTAFAEATMAQDASQVETKVHLRVAVLGPSQGSC